jgi:hypothetical protein
MNAVAEARPSAMSVTHHGPEQGLAARDYLRSVSACWRGDAGRPCSQPGWERTHVPTSPQHRTLPPMP